ncbi:Pyruvate kinase, cytosolic isozyme [Auxenochlorella protothecoides]|uniref:Pyruvate kinase n=1 Tax=Auxenochlorella protothecoides TaxID=3075 RepID=A0A087SJK9_AUXPR|nr:Pyruvate kinase, cytosolic isozyme [Auxenochlorella protothecoides]KFM25913.1 Pyruvate kinase, cytosolic isozyme [Auxenochlorella protothecoides]
MATAHTTKAKTHFFENNDLRQVLHADATHGDGSFTKTKVAFTIGSGSRSVETLCKLLEAGGTCGRIDLTWNSLAYHRQSLANLQEAMKKTRRLCAVMLDCLGREIMVNRDVAQDNDGTHREPDATTIVAGSTVVLTTDTSQAFSASLFPISYPGLPAMVEPGDNLFVGRYLVSGADASSLYMRVEAADETSITCTALSGAVLSGLLTVFHTERSSEGLANKQNDLPLLTAYDREAVASLAADFDVDFLSLSYCRDAEDVESARAFLSSVGSGHTKVLAKCETRQSLFAFKQLVRAADGIIISRGNLGLDVPPEKMAMIQKSMISTCVVLNKPVLITRVVDTMIDTPRPTRAEATDIANAVLDGADGFLLGAETYRGKYALETVRTVCAIAREAEAAFDHAAHFDHLVDEGGRLAAEGEAHASRVDMMRNLQSVLSGGSGGAARLSKLEAIASSAVRAADKVRAAMIIVVTQTGRAAGLVAKYRPAMPIMTLVVPYLKREGLRWRLEGRSSARQALLTSGLMPVLAAPTPSAGESLLEEAVVLAVRQGMLAPEDHVVTVSRTGVGEYMIKIVSVNEFGSGIKHIRPKSLLTILRGQGQNVPDEEEGEEGEQRESVSRGSSILLGTGNESLVLHTPAGPAPSRTRSGANGHA